MEILVVVLVVCMIITSITADPCLTYENFTADSRRSPSHIESVYENKICDVVLSAKWYRLVGDTGSDLTNDSSVLVSNGCGTTHQRWMNGTVPDVSEGIVDRQICMTSVFSICHSSFTIQVKNCCSFRVYYLKSATSCPEAYCVSPSGIPSVDCPQPTDTTTTTTTASTTTTSTTTTTTTTSTTAPVKTTTTTATTTTLTTVDISDTTTASDRHDTGDKYFTIVNATNSKVLIIVIVLLIVIAIPLIGLFIYKSYKCSKVDTERHSVYSAPIPVQYRQAVPEHVYMDICSPGVAVEKGGVNNRTTTYTGHGSESICYNKH